MSSAPGRVRQRVSLEPSFLPVHRFAQSDAKVPRKAHRFLNAQLQVPAIYGAGAHEGGLMTCGTIEEELDRRAATCVDKILRGANPGELPVEQPTKFKLVRTFEHRMSATP